MIGRRAGATLLFVATFLFGTPATAGARGQDPARALFGQTPETMRPMSVINVSMFGGSGESLTGGGVSEDRSVTGRYYTGLNGSMSHVRRSRGYTFNAGFGTSVWYFPARQRMQTIDRSARTGFDTSLGTRSRLSLAQTLLYTPFRQFGRIVEPETSDIALPIANPDGAPAVGRPSYDLGTAVGVIHEFSDRTSLGLSYTARLNYAGASDNLLTHRGAVSLRVGVGRYAALVLGTAYRLGRSQLSPAAASTQDYDIGLDYNRPLSFSRTTTVSFSSGVALVSRAGTGDDPAELGRRARMIGSVTLNKNVTRNWAGRLAYERNMRFIEGFPEPFYSAGVMGRINGQVGRRFSIVGQADYSNGKTLDTGPEMARQFFRGLQTQVRLNHALSRSWQVFGEQHYTENHLSAAALLSLGSGIVPRRYSRGFRVGLTLWSPRVH